MSFTGNIKNDLSFVHSNSLVSPSVFFSPFFSAVLFSASAKIEEK